ncbi:PREDICTED: ribonuclease H2 subunit C isoform X1 [Polistes dominula]|uniref:Ribonuclease H2 subunit C isoform X1 n=1 Tax=Polistes dominula TaxID=743375 RepID=A0ABM1I0H5_POLDO|nr:PREDICTED: ribonuclease H2 subunit C isoform X1 [Polistes dominula]
MNIQMHVQDVDQEESTIHLMPCKIHFDGPANVSSFFQPFIHETDNENCSISFRGRPLQGKKIQIPKDYKGIIFFEHKKPAVEDIQRNLYSNSFFSEFTYWNYDKIPSKNDALAGALDWIDIAEVVRFSLKLN